MKTTVEKIITHSRMAYQFYRQDRHLATVKEKRVLQNA